MNQNIKTESFKAKNQIEAILFVACEPLSISKLAELTNLEKSQIKEILDELKEDYLERGFNLREIAKGWQFSSQPEFAPQIEKLYRPKVKQLSQASLETLAIIAYRQPLTRGDIEQIRQVKVDGLCNNLLDKELIEEVGRRDSPGRPVLYGTTNKFLIYFGLKNLAELPPLEDFKQENKTSDTKSTAIEKYKQSNISE